MDGTVLNSQTVADRIWGDWATDHGLNLETFLPTIRGVRSVDTIAALQLPGVNPEVEAQRITKTEIATLDGIVIPGGFAPEGMRRHKPMVDLVRAVHDQGSMVAAICHAGWMLASAGIAKDRNVTCVSIIKDDVINAGGRYSDVPVVRDGNIITSRLPSDLPDFCREIVRYLEAAPTRRNDLTKLRSRNASSANYTQRANLVMGPRGRASANYTTGVSVEELTD